MSSVHYELHCSWWRRNLDYIQSVVSAYGRDRRVINGTWNGVEDDVKQDQNDDPADPSTFSISSVHGNSSFSLLISVSS
jgi:hypothetical protein